MKNYKTLFFLIFTLCLILIIFTSCSVVCDIGNGKVIKKNINLKDFNSIIINTEGNLYLKRANSNSMVIEAEENLFTKLTPHMDYKELNLDINGCIKNTKPINYYIYYKNIDEITLKGNTNIYSQDILKGDTIYLNFEGNNKAKLNLNFNKVRIKSINNLDIKLKGMCDDLNIETYRKSNINAEEFNVNIANVNLNGEGNGTFNVDENIYAEAEGNSVIKYYGKPKIRIKEYGNGKVINLSSNNSKEIIK